MVVDSSAILAILLQEADADQFARKIEAVEQPRISAATVVEVGIVLLARAGPQGRVDLVDLLEQGGFIVEPVTTEQVDLALHAFERYGKGMGHAAKLNYGDCFSYALATVTGERLLFKGKDFSATDVPSA
ncbi:MAG: type II toxin-antitoxin system VapC family toxin [Kiloniellales bacterium]|nr:type II toxin-antitoxin system VapC family toxin [Kiloniellales bacterium]